MDEQNNRPNDVDDDGAYVVEDTGESLNDFNLEREQARASAGSAAGGEIDKLRQENQELRDQYLRSRADFENFRKRTERDKADYFKYALADSMRELLPVLDNFERALAAPTDDSANEYRKGVELIYKQLLDVLTKNGLRSIDEANVPFDPTIHEGIVRDERTDVPSHMVTEILQKGYMLNDRLLRPAMVRVSVGGPEHTPDE